MLDLPIISTEELMNIIREKTRFTKIYKPWEVIYKEEFATEEEAIKREKYFKSSAGRRLVKKILNNNKLPR